MISRFGRFVLGGMLAVLIGSVAAPASGLLFEPFNYPNGPLVTVAGGLWSTHSGVSGQMEVTAERLDMRVPETEDVNVLLPGQPYPATTNIILYASFTVNFSTLPAVAGQYFGHFKGSGTSNFRAKVFGLTSGASDGQYRLGIANSVGSTASATNALDLSLNTDYRVYVRYIVSNGVTTLWVNPTAEGSPSITGSDSTSGATLTSFALRQDTGIGVIAFDDLRIGTSFADVYAAPTITPPSITQQPANTSAVEGGVATFIAAASGTGPLSYQWKFNSDPIIGATNTTLTLTGLTTNGAGQYSVTITNLVGSTNSAAATLTVLQPNASGTLSLVHYNVKGNFAADWSTNAVQVQAIARQLQYLNPDLITLNEIPNGFRYEMTNWMTAFFPTYNLAVSPGTDGSIRSGVLSRFPITRAQSWLDGVSLTNFGYDGVFTRDLFEAEINVPGASEPLHVFSTHLKSGSDVDSQSRRAAECSAISNFLVTVFLPTTGQRPYVLTGDLNEDIDISMSQNDQPIQRLTVAATGLQLTTPVNPFNLNRFTHSIQGSLDARFDYVLPAGVLAANVIASQVFRTDLLPEPPPPLQTNDDVIASDHLPVQMIFNYPDPVLRATLAVTNQTVVMTWPALLGREFQIESSPDLAGWSLVASNIVAQSSRPTWTNAATSAARFYRVVRTP